MQERVRSYLVERSRLLTAISHDLKTPITRLRLRAEMLADAEIRAQDAARPRRDADHGRHHARLLPHHRQGRAAPAGRRRRADRERVRGPARVRAGAERARRGARPLPRRPAGAAPLPGEPGRERGALRRRRRHRGDRLAAAAAHRGRRPRPGHPRGRARARVRAVLPPRRLAQHGQRRHRPGPVHRAQHRALARRRRHAAQRDAAAAWSPSSPCRAKLCP